MYIWHIEQYYNNNPKSNIMKNLSIKSRNEIINFGLDHFDGLDKVYGCDLHHELFNMHFFACFLKRDIDEFINEYGAFDMIARVVTYEQDNFGEISTNIADREKVVNMFVYTIGEELLQEIEILTFKYWDNEMTADQMAEIKTELKKMIR